MADLFTFVVYLITLFFSVIFIKKGASISSVYNPFYGKIVSGFGLLTMIIVSGLRYNTGTDYESYAFLYDEIAIVDDPSSLDLESGYVLIVEFLNYLNLGAWSFFLVAALLTYGLFVYSYKNYTPILYLGVFFFITYGFYFYSFNGIRQAVAMSALAVAIQFAVQRKIIPFLLVILAGGLVHKSLFLFFPFYFFIHRINIPSIFWYIAFGISLILHFVPFEDIIDLQLISDILSDTEVDYGNFATELTDNADEVGGITLGYAVRVGIGFFILSFYTKITKLDPSTLPYFTLSLIGIILYNSFSHILFMTRINYYFLLFSTFTLAFIVQYLYKSRQEYLANSILVVFVILYCYGIYVGENGCSPYRFIEI